MQASLADVHGVIVARGGDSQVILLKSAEILGVRRTPKTEDKWTLLGNVSYFVL